MTPVTSKSGRDVVDDSRSLDSGKRLAVVVGCSLVVAASCYLFFVRTSLGQRFDDGVYAEAQRTSFSLGPGVGHLVYPTLFYSYVAAGVILVVIGFVRRRVSFSVVLLGAGCVAVGAADVLKSWAFSRPVMDRNPATSSLGRTFPSGHTAAAVAAGLALVVITSPRWRGLVATVSTLYATVVASDVQTAPIHRPSDVLGGALVAFAVISAVVALLHLFGWVPAPPPRRNRRGAVVVATAAVVVAGLGTWRSIRALSWLADHPRDTAVSASVLREAHWASLAVSLAMVVLLFCSFVLLIGSGDFRRRTPPSARGLDPSSVDRGRVRGLRFEVPPPTE